MNNFLSCAKMFCVGLLQRRLALSRGLPQVLISKMSFCEEKKPATVFLWGGGLGKLQGGLKEEEYFISITQELMDKMRTKKDDVDYMPNWDEFQKTLDHSSIYNTSCMNKHKNVLEESFFLKETAENLKILQDRAKEDPDIIDSTVAGLEHLKADSDTIK